ncbi:MAG: acyltransferase [Kiritimatiellae bacterium]|nr:acyltransferase [Kiritimatiellia bacterium]MBP5226787.1 acyltransferase [Kiritimatiellia bacterium]
MHETTDSKRIVFLDYLRIIACLMVMIVHSCEPFYFDADGNTCFRSAGDAFWATWIDSAVRASVPLFVIASSYLLFPLKVATGAFYRRRLTRVVIPFVIWALIYFVQARPEGWFKEGTKLLFNFPDAAGHLWFVPMLLGLYLLMPLLSPWAEKATEKEVRGWLLVWLFTTTFPFLRKLWGILFGDPPFGVVPYLFGECPWNMFGTFHYVSGFFGYLLLGFYFKRFAPTWTWRRTLATAIPLWLAGMAIVGTFFYLRIPAEAGFPVTKPYATAVDLEMSWEFCSTGVAMTVIAYFLILRKFRWDGAFYRWIIRPASEASYGTYLMHMLLLTPFVEYYRQFLPTPAVIPLTALSTLLAATAISVTIRKIPVAGKWFVG